MSCTKNRSITIFTLILISISVNSVYGFQANSESQNHTVVKMDKRIELMNIIQYLAEDLLPTESPYQNQVGSYFAKFKNHKAVQFYKEHKSKEIKFNWGDGISNGHALNAKYELSDPDMLLAETKPWFKEFSVLLNDFVKDTNFEEFIKQEDKEFQASIGNFNKMLIEGNFIESFSEYWGIRRGKHVFVINLLTNCGGMSPYSENPA